VRLVREVRARADARVNDDRYLLVRFNDDVDVPNVVRLARADAHLYRVLPGYEAAGALTLSVFLVSGAAEARTLTAGLGQTRFGLTTAGHVRGAGFDVVATTVLEDGRRCRSPIATPTSS